MRYKEALKIGKEILGFICQNYYTEKDNFLEYAQKAYPESSFEINNGEEKCKDVAYLLIKVKPIIDDETLIHFRIDIKHKDIQKLKPPMVNGFYIENTEDELDDQEIIKIELIDSIEDKLQELERFGFSPDDISESMIKIIKKLLSEWTFPDDRYELLNEEYHPDKTTIDTKSFQTKISEDDFSLYTKIIEHEFGLSKKFKTEMLGHSLFFTSKTS